MAGWGLALSDEAALPQRDTTVEESGTQPQWSSLELRVFIQSHVCQPQWSCCVLLSGVESIHSVVCRLHRLLRRLQQIRDTETHFSFVTAHLMAKSF